MMGANQPTEMYRGYVVTKRVRTNFPESSKCDGMTRMTLGATMSWMDTVPLRYACSASKIVRSLCCASKGATDDASARGGPAFGVGCAAMDSRVMAIIPFELPLKRRAALQHSSTFRDERCRGCTCGTEVLSNFASASAR